MTGFKKLKSFKYENTRDDDDSQDNDFILLKYTDGEEKYYYVDAEKRKNLQVDYGQNPTNPRLVVYRNASVAFDFQCEF